MSAPYAFYTDGRASGIPIALWSCAYQQGTLERKPDLGFAPIQSAYVACVQVSEDGVDVAVRAEHIRYGRTNKVGWVVRRERDALGDEGEVIDARAPITDPPPTWFRRSDPVVFEVSGARADPTLLYGLPNERYRIFWSYSQELFQLFCQELDADPAAAIVAWRAGLFEMVPFGKPTPFGGVGLLDTWERNAVSRVLFPGARTGYHAGWFFKDQFTPAIFDATPETFRALHATELLQWCCERLVHDDPDWPYLWSLSSVIQAAERGAPIPDLAKDLPAGGVMATHAAAMRKYVYECAKRGIRNRNAIVDACSVGVGAAASRWEQAAEFIQRGTELEHPATSHKSHLDEFFFTDMTKRALIAYFDMYVLGFDASSDAEALSAHGAHVHDALGWVRAKQQAQMRSFRHDELMRDLASHVPAADWQVRVELNARYMFQAANAQVPYWEAADAAMSAPDAWKKMAAFLTWVGESSDLLSEMFQPFLAHYVSTYKLSVQSTETMIRYLYRYHLTLRGHLAEQVLPQSTATLRLESDPATGRAVARLYRGARSTLLGEYELLTGVAQAPVAELHQPLGKADTENGLKLLRRAQQKGQVREFVMAKRSLEVPNEDSLSGFPKLLAATGALIKAGLAIRGLVDEAKQKGLGGAEFDVYLEVAEETFQAMDPLSDVLSSVLAKAGVAEDALAKHFFFRGASALAKLGTVIESSRLLLAGGQTLHTLIVPSQSSTDLAQYLARGETTAAWFEGAKGLVQVASGAAGVGTLVLGAGTTVAAIPLSAVVAVGLVAVATINVLIYAETGGGSPVDDYLRAVREARRHQFRLTADGRILGPGEKPVLGHTDPGSGGGGESGSCQLARQLATLNEIARHPRRTS